MRFENGYDKNLRIYLSKHIKYNNCSLEPEESLSNNNIIKEENNLNNLYLSNLPQIFGVGDDTQEWKYYVDICQNAECLYPTIGWEGTVNRQNEDLKFLNVEKSNEEYIVHKIDSSKLIIPLLVDRKQYNTHEELFDAVKEWWIKSPDYLGGNKPRKGHHKSTINHYIQNARAMQKHPKYPVNWFEFDPHQIINQMLYRQTEEYPKIQMEKGDPTYGDTQLNNFWKIIRTMGHAFGIDVTYFPWRPPTPPENKRKNIPRPYIVNKLIHHRYTKDRFTNALIRTLLTVGFQAGVRPAELISLKTESIDFEAGHIYIRESKKRYRERPVWIEQPVMYSRQQNSLKNWIEIWRPRCANKQSGDFLFIKRNGKPFRHESELRRFLAKHCKPVWNHFCPKIMRDWNAIARLIRTKLETKKWDTRQVTKALGHRYEKTTEVYIEYAENYFRNDSYDWLRAVLKFHPTSIRMQKLMKQPYRTSQEISKKLTYEKIRSPEDKLPSVGDYGPGGIRTRDL